jgi:transcriptional regulator with XRE-family HTH domain
MSQKTITFGEYISYTRKLKNISQKDLATNLEISPQYLNDIEHDKRTPSAPQLIDKFASTLDLKPEYLYYLAGRIPEEDKKKKLDEKSFTQGWHAFRKEIGGKK